MVWIVQGSGIPETRDFGQAVVGGRPSLERTSCTRPAATFLAMHVQLRRSASPLITGEPEPHAQTGLYTIASISLPTMTKRA